MGKLSPHRIIINHIHTLYKNRNGKKSMSISDITIQLVLPVVIGGFAYFNSFKLDNQDGLLSGVSILATLLGAVAVFVFQIRVQLRQNKDVLMEPDDTDLIDELFFNILWIILVGFILSVLLIIAETVGQQEDCEIWRIVSAVSVALSINIVLTLFMVLKRLVRVYERVGMHLRK